MRIFTTGASGWIGSAVVPELLAAGHRVVGLARSEASAEALVSAGVVPWRGSLSDLDSLRAGAEAADGVIHLAFNHDFSDYAGAGRTERAVVETLGEALEGSGRPLVVASGVAGLTVGRMATEEDPTPNVDPDAPRGASEHLALSFAARGVRSVAVRFAPTVHGRGDKGFTAMLVRIARERGVAAYIGDGANRWPAVHRNDAAHLVRLAFEQAQPGAVVHAVGEEGIATRDIAAAIGREFDVPTTALASENAQEHFGWIGALLGLDIPAASTLTRERFAWNPTGSGLLEDIAGGAYGRS
ncbi:SDR family oxidoreductase [Sinomonas terrae]|uniref:SDR family oxidoreductase n=1 Tax=Sinomonas terrae TaxID=2908838 RepID=A0ABS9U2V8_9MICC|nr:SDR family oxidoreductase [Sinomonas terrae]MCH6471033.1 SDR family oxidoreductase [Sinomonas terrae]